MATIKFSHPYEKLLNVYGNTIDSARLQLVIPIKLEELPKRFLDYDTNDRLFALPSHGDYLMLVFEKPKESVGTCARNLFTTLRRSTPEKAAYYSGLIGQWFDVEIERKAQ